MPSVRQGEKEKDYVGRCIPIVMDEGTAKNPEQASAICHSMYSESKKAEEEGKLLTHTDLVRIASRKMAEVGEKEFIKEMIPKSETRKFSDFDECVDYLVEEEGLSEEEAEDECENMKAQKRALEEPWTPQSTIKAKAKITANPLEKGITEESMGVDRNADISIMVGDYPELGETGIHPKIPSPDEELNNVTVPKPRAFGVVDDEIQGLKNVTPKKLWGLEEELPENLKGRPYGVMEDEVKKLKQP